MGLTSHAVLCCILILSAVAACGLWEAASPTSVPTTKGHYCGWQNFTAFKTPVPVMPDNLTDACRSAKADKATSVDATAQAPLSLTMQALREKNERLIVAKTATAAPAVTATALVVTAFEFACPERSLALEGFGMFETRLDFLEAEAMKWCYFFESGGFVQGWREKSASYSVGDPRYGFLFPSPEEVRYYRTRNVDVEFDGCMVPRETPPYFKLTFPDKRNSCRGSFVSLTPTPEPLTPEIKYQACQAVKEVGYENHSWKARDPAVLELFNHISLTTHDQWVEFCAPILRDDYVTE